MLNYLDVETTILLLQIVITAIITILSVVPTHPKLLALHPFYRNAMAAINKLKALEERENFNINGELYQFQKLGRVKKGDRGFKELLLALKIKYDWLNEESVSEIGLAFGDKIPVKTTMLGPNVIVYVIATSSNGKKTFIPVIFYPFEPQITLELRDLRTWIKEIVNSKIASQIIAWTMIWIVLALLQLIIQ